MTERRLVTATAVVFLVQALSFLVLGSMAQAADLAFGIFFTEIGLFLGPAVLFARAMNLEAGHYLGLRKVPARSILVVIFIAAAGNYLFAAGGMGLLDRVLPESWHIVDVEQILGMEKGLRLGLVLFGVVVLAPICEEAAFRGFVQTPLVVRYGPAPGIALTALLFSALHADPIGFLPRFELGLLFGWLVWRTGSLWASILAHGVNNGAAALLYLTVGRTEAAPGVATAEETQGLVGAMLVGLLVLVPTLAVLRRMTHASPPVLAAVPRLDPTRPMALRSESPEFLTLVALALAVLGALVLLVLAVMGVAQAGAPA